MTTASGQIFEEFKNIPQKANAESLSENIFSTWNPFSDKKREESLTTKEKDLSSKVNELEAKIKQVEDKEKELEVQWQAATNLLSSLTQAQNAMWNANLPDMIQFTLSLVENLLAEKIKEDPSLLVTQIKAALEEVKTSAKIKIHMNPEDLQFIQSSNKQSLRDIFADGRIGWEGDPHLQRGGVFIDTDQFRLDASIMTLLKNVKTDVQVASSKVIPETTSE